jgi:Holliday junction resolvasome RuvABC endonuclease subunit
MKNTNVPKSLVLGIHPTSHGFGWVLFENPSSVIDWGNASARGARRKRLITRFERLLTKYQPSTVVLEEFEGARSKPIQTLCKEMTHLALLRGADAIVYPRSDVQSVFVRLGATTRHEIATVVAKNLNALSHRMPKKRRVWSPEDERQSLFDAAALVLTYYALMD